MAVTRRTKKQDANETAALLQAYKRMLSIRIAQEELVKLYMEKKIFSMVHFYIGQEAVAVGVCDALKKGDKVMGNHRSHGHYLAKGGNFRRLVCELLGKANGSARGKGGSMHMVAKEVNFVGSTPLLGSVVPISAGVAFEQKYNKRGTITVAFYGDGASEEGVVYETYNLAALYKLPLLLVIENNLFSINSYIKNRRSGNYDVKKIVEGLGVRYEQADGNDYHDVHEKARALVDSIREESEPAVLECMTYRHMAHSTPLREESYRSEDTAEKRQESDSLKKIHDELLGAGISEKRLSALENTMRASVRKDITFAERSPYPKKSELYTNMYAT
ncbi:thiamine pyrophosphate-dependent dehydrogenase E1 component subunit alpha [Candidatus Kaiserbacteria bacterium]|nr:thiamine pyrophosphate-dependent dehydrogenase E1 component subunit alpha [Candidatus Kaiserbacteria bacterium]